MKRSHYLPHVMTGIIGPYLADALSKLENSPAPRNVPEQDPNDAAEQLSRAERRRRERALKRKN